MTDTIEQYDLTDDATRRKIFWLLQRVSSLSLWTRKREAFARFANAYEHAVNTWPDMVSRDCSSGRAGDCYGKTGVTRTASFPTNPGISWSRGRYRRRARTRDIRRAP